MAITNVLRSSTGSRYRNSLASSTLDRQPGPVLDGVFGQQAGVVRGAAGDDEDLVDLAQFLIGKALLVEHDATVDEMPQQGVGDRGGLLGDLLEHEVVVATLFGGVEIPVDVELPVVPAGLQIVPAEEVGDPVAVGGQHHRLVLAELHGVPGVLDERRPVGADEHLVLTDADDEQGWTGERPRSCPDRRRWRTPG